MRAGEWVKLHLYLQPLPIARITAWAPPPVRSAAASDSHRSVNPTVNCACEGSRLCAPYENLMPDDLRWSWGRDASTGERLQIQIIISREVWLHRDHNKSIACRLMSKPHQWGDFPGGTVDSTLPMQGAQVWSLVRELHRTCMLQLRVHMPQLRSPPAATKTPSNRINKY